MKISQINPIGYDSKTQSGNTYKKSNTWKYLTAIPAAINVAAVIKPNNQYLKSMTLTDNISFLFKKTVPPKYVTAVNILGAIVDTGLIYACAKYLDNSINKKRAEKADLAQKTTK